MMRDAFSSVKLGSGRLEVGGWRLEVGGECGCGLWLDYGRDMLIMLHTLFSAYFLIFMTGETQLKISNSGMRSYAIHTPSVRHFIRCSFFFQGNISLAESGVEKASGSSACFRF